MAASHAKLTKRMIDAASPGEKRKVLWDAEIRGFGLRIEPSGTKAFLVRFRPKSSGRSGPKRFITLGRYGSVSLEQARSEAKRILGRVASGDDPAQTMKEAIKAPTVSQLVERFLAEQASKKKASTAALYTHYLRALVVPVLGNKKAADVTHADIIKLHGAIGRTRPTTANRAVATLSAMFTFGVKVGDLPAGFSPTKGVDRFREKPKARYLSSAELVRLGAALHEAETLGLSYMIDESGPDSKHAAKPENRRRKIDPFAIAAIRLLLLTGARLREIIHSRWEFFDAERGLLILPDSKTGGKSIYLGAAALALIGSLPRLEGNPFMFPGNGNRLKTRTADTCSAAPRADLKKPWAAICKAANLPHVRLHDLRHTFASLGAGAQLGLPIIGKLLGHSQAGTTQRYAHLDADPIRRAVQRIDATISDALERR